MFDRFVKTTANWDVKLVGPIHNTLTLFEMLLYGHDSQNMFREWRANKMEMEIDDIDDASDCDSTCS